MSRAATFTQKLKVLDGSQTSVERISGWLLFHWNEAADLAAAWRDHFEAVPQKKMLNLLYLANHALQSRKDHRDEIRAAWAGVLPAAFRALTAASGGRGAIHGKAKRLLGIWVQRKVMSGSVLSLLSRCLAGASSASTASRKRKRATRDASAKKMLVCGGSGPQEWSSGGDPPPSRRAG